MLTTDAAANEILASNIGAGHRSSKLEGDTVETALTPNLKMIGRDKAHSFRRLMTRPFKCDEYLDSIVDEFVTAKSSVVQRLHNSWDLKRILTEEIEAADPELGTNMKSLRAAKHRFESLAAPMGRCILYLPQFLKTMQRICESRADNIATEAKAFLQGLTAEKLLQLSLLADGLDETMLLVRCLSY